MISLPAPPTKHGLYPDKRPAPRAAFNWLCRQPRIGNASRNHSELPSFSSVRCATSFSCSFFLLIPISWVGNPVQKTSMTHSPFVYICFPFSSPSWCPSTWSGICFVCIYSSLASPQSFSKLASWSDCIWHNLHNRFPVCCALRGIPGIFPVSLSRLSVILCNLCSCCVCLLFLGCLLGHWRKRCVRSISSIINRNTTHSSLLKCGSPL